MNTIEIILAGAGSGKTTALARRLEQDIKSGAVRPHAVLATTFTRDAAASLSGRARTRLLSEGLTAQAHQLGAARIGTVNAVCGALVETFAFDLGLSPELAVLDEVAAARHIRACVSEVMTDEDQRCNEHLGKVFDKQFDLEAVVIEIIAAARSNELGLEDLDRSAQRSIDGLASLLDPPTEDLDRALAEAIRELLPVLAASSVGKDKTAAGHCNRALGKLDRGDRPPWPQWRTLSRLNLSKKLPDGTGDAVLALADRHVAHPAFAADLRTAITLSFRVAAGAVTRYQDFKRERGLIDFADQEAYALELLRLSEVAARLREDLDLVMVDEFQDTSPLQLAIFLQLAQIAPTSVWVGDPKQSIYGFRGTDPDMMAAAVEQLEGRDPAFVDDTLGRLFERITPTTLGTSYRSRPPLVRLTSDLFARAFEPQGIPRDRVALEPAHDTEPDGLGPIVEFWDLDIPNKRRTSDYPLAVAAGVHALLERGFDVRVKGDDQATRPGHAGDVAVLSRRRAARDTTASALEGLGRRVVLPREGLLSTLEGRALWAGLRRLVDGRDRHAAAELDRLLAEQPADAWLLSLLRERPESSPSRRVDALRRATAHAGPREAAAMCCDVLDLRTACRRWGDPAQRLANLDAFFAFIDQYADQRSARGGVPTLPGLLAALERARAEKPSADARGVRVADEAITASTWHASKGLEWPVVVLSDIESDFPSQLGGVRVEPNAQGLDLADPLAGRWIRYVPQPYASNTRDATFLDRLANTDAERRAERRRAQEHLRVLYVAWTRARDRLVIAGPAKTAFAKALAAIRDASGPLLSVPVAGATTWAGHPLAVPTVPASPLDPSPRPTETAPTDLRPEPFAWPPASRSPSSATGRGRILELVELGPPHEVHGLEGPGLGEAFHAFIAADGDGDRGARERRAAACLETWGVPRPELATVFVDAADRLDAFLRARFGDAETRREVPVWSRAEDGSVTRGLMDVWVTGHAVVDHKTLLGTRKRQVEAAQAYAGQLECYANVVRAAEGIEVERWVHLPLAGVVVRVSGVENGG